MVKSHLEIAVSSRFNDHGKRYITTKQNPRGGGGGGGGSRKRKNRPKTAYSLCATTYMLKNKFISSLLLFKANFVFQQAEVIQLASCTFLPVFDDLIPDE